MLARALYKPLRCYIPGDHPKFREPDQAYIDRVKSYLRTINPSLVEEDFLDVHASRYRFAQPICEPRFLERLPAIQLPIRGLLVADTSFYYPEDRGMSESIGLGRKMAGMIQTASTAQTHAGQVPPKRDRPARARTSALRPFR